MKFSPSVQRRLPGRPTKLELIQAGVVRSLYDFNQKIADAICDAVMAGGLVTNLNPSLQLPNYQQIFRWKRSNPEFARDLAESIKIRGLACEDMILEIAFKPISAHLVPLARQRIKFLKWLAVRSDPEMFGGMSRRRK